MWKLVLVGFAIYFLYLLFRAWHENQPENRIALFEKRAQLWKERALKNGLRLNIEIETFILDATERDYLRLGERFKHDIEQRLKFAEDWADYTHAVSKLRFARDLLDLDTKDNASDTFFARVKQPHITCEEVERRFQLALGEEFVDRWVQFRDSRERQDQLANERTAIAPSNSA